MSHIEESKGLEKTIEYLDLIRTKGYTNEIIEYMEEKKSSSI